MSYDPVAAHYVNGSFIVWHLVDIVAKGGQMQIGTIGAHSFKMPQVNPGSRYRWGKRKLLKEQLVGYSLALLLALALVLAQRLAHYYLARLRPRRQRPVPPTRREGARVRGPLARDQRSEHLLHAADDRRWKQRPVLVPRYPCVPFCMDNRGTKRVLEYSRLAMGFAHVRAGTRVLKLVLVQAPTPPSARLSCPRVSSLAPRCPSRRT